MISSPVTKRTIKEASQSFVLKRYIDAVRKKHQEDPDYKKWDLTKPLPKLPVPDLKLSIEKYLRCVMPIVSEEAYKKTEQIAYEFIKSRGIGEQLQAILHKVAEEKDNWAYDWWLDDMYMLCRIPLPINSNPGMVFPRENFANEDAQIRFASRLISGIMDYKIYIDDKQLPIDRLTCREKGQPLCMEQYYRLFTSYRIPGVDKDKLIDSRTSLMLEPEHVIVICRNQMYVLDVIVNFTRLCDDQLYHQLKRIKTQSEEDENTLNAFSNIGFLTSLPRIEWAMARAELMKDSTNRDCLDMIERCIFIVCFDKPVIHLYTNNKQDQSDETYIMKEKTAMAMQMIHGFRSMNNSGNRWFDKTMQFIISEDGVCGLNYEHSTAEGIVVIELSEHLFRYMDEKRKQKLHRMPSICELSMPRKLRWKLNEVLNNQIERAKIRFDS